MTIFLAPGVPLFKAPGVPAFGLDCCCGETPPPPECCGDETCLSLNLTISGTTCCPSDTFDIILQDKTDESTSNICEWEITTTEYPPSTSVDGLTQSGVYWLQPFADDPGYCSATAPEGTCYTEVDGNLTHHWYPSYIYPQITTSKVDGTVTISILLNYTVFSYNSAFDFCFQGSGGYVIYEFISTNCLSGPFTFTGATVVPSGFSDFVPPTCTVTVNSLEDCTGLLSIPNPQPDTQVHIMSESPDREYICLGCPHRIPKGCTLYIRPCTVKELWKDQIPPPEKCPRKEKFLDDTDFI